MQHTNPPGGASFGSFIDVQSMSFVQGIGAEVCVAGAVGIIK
jgi:hypothetical protein